MDKKLLIVDEQTDRASGLELYFKQMGLVESCSDGITGLVQTMKFKPDLVVASSTVPRLSGAELCEHIRSASQAVILMLSPGTSEERVACYDAGADEVIGMGISAEEIARKAAVWLRRLSLTPELVLEDIGSAEFGPLTMNRRTHKVYVSKEEISFTRKEFAILWALVSNNAQIVTRDELLRVVWSYETLGDDRMIDTHLNRIRKKLSRYTHMFIIKTIWGVGYKLEEVQDKAFTRIQSLQS